MTFRHRVSHCVVLDCRPTFGFLRQSTQHGCLVVNDPGQRGALWLSMPDTALHMVGRKWIRVTPSRTYDLSDAFDFSSHLASLGVVCTGQLLGVSNAESRRSSPPSLADRWRSWVKRKLSTDKSGLVLGMFAGDKKSVHHDVQRALRQLGLSHLLVVSGYHVSRVLGVFFLLQGQHRLMRMGSVLGVAAVWVFVAATGWSLSAIRAAVMASLGWWFLVRGKSLHTWGMLGAAGCVVAVVAPMSPLQLGAQLSFAATAALISLRGKYLALRVPLRARPPCLGTSTISKLFSLYPANSCGVGGLGPGMLWAGADWVSSGSCGVLSDG